MEKSSMSNGLDRRPHYRCRGVNFVMIGEVPVRLSRTAWVSSS